jgi:hypothetical protein
MSKPRDQWPEWVPHSPFGESFMAAQDRLEALDTSGPDAESFDVDDDRRRLTLIGTDVDADELEDLVRTLIVAYQTLGNTEAFTSGDLTHADVRHTMLPVCVVMFLAGWMRRDAQIREQSSR